MKKKLEAKDCKTARDFDRYIGRSGRVVEIRQNGTSHRIYKFPQTGVSVPVPQHNGDIPRGTRHDIVTMLSRALAVGVIGMIIFALRALLGG